jgi:hypothetical protein
MCNTRYNNHTFYVLGELDPWRWDRYVAPKRRFQTTLRCIITHNTEEFSSTATEVSDLAFYVLQTECIYVFRMQLLHSLDFKLKIV